MIIQHVEKDANGKWRGRMLEKWECKCDAPDWCPCGNCHRCGKWLRRIHDPEACQKIAQKGTRRVNVVRKRTQQDTKTLPAIDSRLSEYAQVVEQAELSATSKAMYVDFATCFVRWMRGDFVPGARGIFGKRPKRP